MLDRFYLLPSSPGPYIHDANLSFVILSIKVLRYPLYIDSSKSDSFLFLEKNYLKEKKNEEVGKELVMV